MPDQTDPQARAAEVIREHKVERDGINTSYFGSTRGWWRCSCGETSPDWENYYRDRETDWPAAHVAAALAEAGLLSFDPPWLAEVYDQRDAARTELAKVKKQGLSLIAELQQVKAEREKWKQEAADLLNDRARIETELVALREGVRALAGDMRSRDLDPWYWSEIADEIDALLGEDQ